MKYLEKVFLIIKNVSEGSSKGLTVMEASEASGLPMSSTHRILNDLIECDVFLKDEKSKRYKFSSRLIPTIQEISKMMNLDSVKAVLENLRDRINETVFLSKLTEDGVTSIMTAESNRMFSFRAKSGVYLPVNCTAAGLAIVAFINEEKAKELMCKGYKSGDPDVKVCPAEIFMDRLWKVKNDGFAFCDEEYEAGLRAVAVPIFNSLGFAEASITAIAPAERFADLSEGSSLITRLKEAANSIQEFI